MGKVAEYLRDRLRRGPVHFTLIDPDKSPGATGAAVAQGAVELGSDLVLLGGSTGISPTVMGDTARAVKRSVHVPVVIFPEGGRTPNGQLQPFLPGAFFLAIKAQADIVPIALVDTFSLLPMNTYHIKCQPLEMRVGEPVSTVGLTLSDMDEISAKVKSAIEALRSVPKTT